MSDCNCPYCGSTKRHILEAKFEYNGVRRRLECKACEKRYSSLEVVVPNLKKGRGNKLSLAPLLSPLYNERLQQLEAAISNLIKGYRDE